MNDYSEDSLVEQPAIELFRELGWQTANCFYEKFGSNGTLGRETSSEGEEGIVSLDTMIRGTCEPARLLDIIENFTLFSEASGGKSYSMVFFSQKVLRKIPGNFTFVIVTDRLDLDNQIYKNFAGAGAVTEEQVQAEDGDHLQQLLREDHRYIFTLIQKFHTKKGETYPPLSARKDIIVITDEAHRSQYDVLALNMRNALPKAAFIAFTGTPLIVGEEKTKSHP